jgi:IclR family KDG regulon transcriptional repressor
VKEVDTASRQRPARVSAADPASTARKAIEVLEILANSKSGVGLNEIARSLNSGRSSVLRIIAALEEKGLVRRDADGRRYALTPRLLALGNAALDQLEWYDVSKPHLQNLSDLVGETCHLAVLDSGEVIYVAKTQPPDPIPLVARVGFRAAAYCTALGKVLLAALSDEQVRQYLASHELHANTPRTLTDPARLISELEQVRRQGFALDQEENRLGLRCVAAPIRNHRAEVLAAISVTAPAFRMTGRTQNTVIRQVQEAAVRISVDLGGGTPATIDSSG